MEEELGMLVLQQQRELKAAKALESDLDLAFKIQVQETLAASLLPNPSSTSSSSSSSSSSCSFPPIPSSSDVPHHLHLKDEEDEAINPLHLQTLELERFRQERKDRALCEFERRRAAFDLKRRIHDQAFTNKIHQMPAKRWAKCGDIFEKPIVAAASHDSYSSSSASAVLETGEPFWLYFKGLVSTEQVNGWPVSMTVMGIAVCDLRDNLLLKIQKSLLGVGYTQGIVEVKALIEGLQAVISLDIKDVDVCFDFLPLFNQRSLVLKVHTYGAKTLPVSIKNCFGDIGVKILFMRSMTFLLVSNAFLRHFKDGGMRIPLDFVKEMPRAGSRVALNLSSSIGPLLFAWVIQLLFPVILNHFS